MLAALGAAAIAPAHAAPETAPMAAPQAEQYVQVSLISEHAALEPGSTAMLGVRFKITEGWHIYWDGQNDSGASPSIELTLPSGYAEPIIWPAPVRHKLPGDILDHVYEGDVTLIIPVKIPAAAKRGDTVNIAAKCSWLVCKDICVAEEGELSMKLPVAAEGAKPVASADAPQFTKARQRVPQPYSAISGDVSIVWSELTEGDAKVKITSKTAKGIEFYPAVDSLFVNDTFRSCAAKGNTLDLSVEHDPKNTAGLHGVLALTVDGKQAFYTIKSPRPAGPPTSTKPAPPKTSR